MYYFESIIDEIENSLACDIDVNALAKKAGMSVYEFRRIFTFVTKISFSEYIRKRRLSLAALELYENTKTVTQLSAKYGYDSPSSFSRAFKEFHGVSPKEVMTGSKSFKLFTRISTEIITAGGCDITYSVFKKDAFMISGFAAKSEISDTECCENVWDAFYKWDGSEKILAENDKIYAVYDDGCDFVNCCIGEKSDKYPDSIYIPASDWVCFRLTGTEDDKVNEFYKNILSQWFASSGYARNTSVPNIEVFPSDMSDDCFEWEVWIAVAKENT